MGKLLIIYYHEVVENGQGFSYQKIDKDKFENQMKYLYENGYHTLLFSDLDKPLPEKAIIVSFDDGFRTVYENAAPVMKKYKIKGNVYLPTAYIGVKPQFMNWSMVKNLVNDFEFQAHTHNHVDIRTLTDEQLCQEIQLSDQFFYEKLGYLPKAFCVPFGTYDKTSINRLKAQNRYSYLLGSYYGSVCKKNMQTILPRIGISNDDSLKIFEKKLKGKLNWKGSLQKIRLTLHNLKKERISVYNYN